MPVDLPLRALAHISGKSWCQLWSRSRRGWRRATDLSTSRHNRIPMLWHLYHHRWHFPKGFASWAKLLCLLQESPGFNSGPEVVGAGVAPQISQLLVIIGSRCCGTCVIIAGTSQRGSRLGPSSRAWLSSPLTTVPPTHKHTPTRTRNNTPRDKTRQYDIRPSLKAAKTREPPL